MVMMVRTQRRRFRNVHRFLVEELPKLESRPRVWKAFCDWAQRDAAGARLVLADGSAPTFFAVDLGGSLGFFTPDKPDTIQISRQLVSEFDDAPDDDRRRALLEATILHEMVHWSLANQRLPEERNGVAVEAGVEFERAAYGERVLAENDLRHAMDEPLGTLSRRYESRGSAAAIGRDSTGGWSYGLYQLASAKGRVGEFIESLRGAPDAQYRHFADELRSAGGDAAARAGTQEFVTAWRALAAEPAFGEAQHAFIKTTHYDPFAAKLRGRGLDLDTRSKVLRDVAWSVSVQHGPGATGIFTDALATLDAGQRRDDAALINAIYDERSRVDVHFSSSEPHVRDSVLARFVSERAAALAALNA